MIDLTPIFLTLKLATIVTLILCLIGLPIARLLFKKQSYFHHLIKTVISLPLILPPTVLGFYLLIFFNDQSVLGEMFHIITGSSFLFTFNGLVFASVIYSLPFMINPVISGLESLDPSYAKFSRLFGKSSLVTFLNIELPLIKPSIISGMILTFAHTIGEFGVILMIGGNIPNETEVASISIYKAVEIMDYSLANSYAFILLGISIILIFSTYLIKGKKSIL